MKILSSSEHANTYIPIRTSQFCIGYDGLGAVDAVESDITSPSGAKFNENPVFEEMHLAVVEGTPRICMRRAVRRFDCYYGDEHNLLILSARAYQLVGQAFETSVDGFRPVDCHFGTWSGSYVLGKLRRHAALPNKLIAFEKSRFVKANSPGHYQSLVEKGERDPLDESHVDQRGLRFGTALQVMEAHDFSQAILLEDATMNFADVTMFNYKPGISYLRLPVYQQLLTLKQTQRQVLGIVGSQPFAKLHFAPD